MIFKKKKVGANSLTVNKNAKDDEIIAKNAGELGVIKIYLEGSVYEVEEAFERVKRIADFAPTSPKASVYKIDEQINEVVLEFKNSLSLGKVPEEVKLDWLKKIEVLYAERAAVYNQKD